MRNPPILILIHRSEVQLRMKLRNTVANRTDNCRIKLSRLTDNIRTRLLHVIVPSVQRRLCERRKLPVNVGKRKVIRCSRSTYAIGSRVRLDGEMLEEVECFKYMGSHLAKTGGVVSEMGCGVKKSVLEVGASEGSNKV